MKGKTACLDYPSCGWFQELMAMSPNGKVLLSVRDSPGSWFLVILSPNLKTAFIILKNNYSRSALRTPGKQKLNACQKSPP